MTSLDIVIREVASKNGVGLRKDDQVMTLPTIMNRIIEDHTKGLAERQAEMLGKMAEKIEEMAIQVDQDSRRNAEKGLNAILEIARNNVSQIMTAGADEMVKKVNTEMLAVLAQHRADVAALERSLRRLRKVIGLSIVAVLVTAVVVCIVVLA